MPLRKETATLSIMESHSAHPSPDEAAAALNTLQADRERLATSVHVPWALLAAFGGVGAWWVSTAVTTRPGESYDPPSSSWLALVGALVVAYLVQRETGVRFRAMGARAGWVMVGILAVCLLLFSISLGLVSMGMQWAVALTSVVAFTATTWLAGVAYRSAVEHLRHE
ncbi:hypothetical protein [Sanguibacter suarezii]|uniref:hypothetical protein n=1 Tax=Sanguibacter suarezii TaxID=60921 RepID=UPI001FE0CFCA|nr:hypothetical protein [Sanguibacter suarezii]